MSSDKQDTSTPKRIALISSPKNAFLSLGAIIGAAIAIWTALAWGYGKYVSWESRRPQAEYRRLESLEPGIQAKVFNDRVGIEPQSCHQHGRVRSCMYVRPYELVQTTIDKDDQVLSFSVTITAQGFTPTMKWAGRPITLGKTYIEEALSGPPFVPDRVTGYADMRSSGYLESSGSFGVANFQECAVGVNTGVNGKGYVTDSSFLTSGHPVAILLARATPSVPKRNSQYPWPGKSAVWASKEKSSELLSARAVQAFRRAAIVNTIVITAPNVDVTALPELVP
jgi:hypothetical protein